MKTPPEFPSGFHWDSLRLHSAFLPALCLFSVKLCKWEESVALRCLSDFSSQGLCTDCRTADFTSSGSLHWPPPGLSLALHPPRGGSHPPHPIPLSHAATVTQKQLTSDLPLVCSLTLKKSVELLWPPGKWNLLQKENSELRVVEKLKKKKKKLKKPSS